MRLAALFKLFDELPGVAFRLCQVSSYFDSPGRWQ